MRELKHEENVLLQIAQDYVKGKNGRTHEMFSSLELDWKLLYDLSVNQKIVPIVYQALKDNIPSDYLELFQNKCNTIRKNNALNFEEVKLLTEKGDSASLLFIKGIVLSQLLYNDPFLRSSGDIDTLIREKDLSEINQLLINEGYVHACGKGDVYNSDFDNLEILPYPILKDFKHHEYFEYYKQKGEQFIILEIQRYIHNTITSESYLNRFFNSSRLLTINDISVRTLNIDYTLLYLIESIHTDSNWYQRGPKLNKYMELAMFITKYESEINWEQLFQNAQEFQMIDIVHNVFKEINEIFKETISHHIVETYTYDCRHKSLAMIWDCPIVERIFQSDNERKLEIFKNLKRLSYSTEALTQAYGIREESMVNEHEQTENLYLYLDNDKYNFRVKYIPSIDSEQVSFTFWLPDELLHSNHDWEIILNTIDPKLDSENLDLHTYSIAKREGNIQFGLQSDGSIERISYSMIRVYIPATDFQHYLAYKIIIRERVYGEIYHSLNSDGYTDQSYWKSPTLIYIPLVRELNR
ncbi:hypothetical protein D3P07_05330 [Paenibacillus sp. 1011MAR3C5]|uniref:nucleotidyltransferase family protein n=1 Tax=Paenibacillus sp. 1011MAR3C5 TaxID=1675787 RepID=UPI000E6B8F28|nr:nucleotidyltransferase family protein [Paenibacillus sp. 1011MAR3C5]RJE89661.1 hypothetical protein D3P07_05330 [Paenibacillus sp. 1011MAR3C5]